MRRVNDVQTATSCGGSTPARARPRQRRRRARQADARRRRPSRSTWPMRAGSICDPAGAPGTTWLLSRVIDRGTASRSAGGDRRGARQPRHHADRHGHAARLLARLHLPGRRFRAGARAARRHRHGAVAAGEEIATRKGEVITAIRQDDDNPAVRATEALMALAVPGRPSVRPPHEGVDRGRRSADARRSSLRLHAERFAPARADGGHRRRRRTGARAATWRRVSSAAGARRRRRRSLSAAGRRRGATPAASSSR